MQHIYNKMRSIDLENNAGYLKIDKLMSKFIIYLITT